MPPQSRFSFHLQAGGVGDTGERHSSPWKSVRAKPPIGAGLPAEAPSPRCRPRDQGKPRGPQTSPHSPPGWALAPANGPHLALRGSDSYSLCSARYGVLNVLTFQICVGDVVLFKLYRAAMTHRELVCLLGPDTVSPAPLPAQPPAQQEPQKPSPSCPSARQHRPHQARYNGAPSGDRPPELREHCGRRVPSGGDCRNPGQQ